MFLTMTYTLFRMKLFDIHDLSGNRNTDAYSVRAQGGRGGDLGRLPLLCGADRCEATSLTATPHTRPSPPPLPALRSCASTRRCSTACSSRWRSTT
jgi:hypothetical protein